MFMLKPNNVMLGFKTQQCNVGFSEKLKYMLLLIKKFLPMKITILFQHYPIFKNFLLFTNKFFGIDNI